ncbi:MAG: hypothetical protein HY735_27915 [Verrucomicrobia bacterium]|nr:hypothetical protein [Verrucomicrobiota bacterium]
MLKDLHRRALEQTGGSLTPALANTNAEFILTEFYEEAMTRVPERLREYLESENRLVTPGGYPQSLPLDQVEQDFATNDSLSDIPVSPSLQALVDAHLLRPERRGDGSVRFELVHDRLCGVVAQRQARRADEEKRHRLEAEAAHERAHAEELAVALSRARKMALVALVVAVLALAAGALAWWQSRLAKRAQTRAFEARLEAEGLINFMIFELRDKLKPLGRLGLMSDVNRRVMAYHQRLSSETDPPEFQHRRIVNLAQLGDGLRARGDLAGASAFYTTCLAIARKLAAQDPANVQLQEDLAVTTVKFGNVLEENEDLSSALTAYRESQRIFKTLAAEDHANPNWQRHLLAVSGMISGVLEAQGDWRSASQTNQYGLDIARKLAAQDQTNLEWQHDLWLSLWRVGEGLLEETNSSGALQAFREGLNVAGKLVAQEPANAQWQEVLLHSFINVGNALDFQRDLPGALQAYTNGLDIARKLAAKDPTNAEWQRNFSVSLDSKGNVLLDQGDLPGALQAYRQSQSILKKLAAQDATNVRRQRDFAFSHERPASVFEKQKKWREAAEAYGEEVRLARPWIERLTNSVEWAEVYARGALGLHRAAKSLADNAMLSSARQDVGRARQILLRFREAGRLPPKPATLLKDLDTILQSTLPSSDKPGGSPARKP